VRLRRTLLLVAVVFGLAAIASSLSQPRRESREPVQDAARAPSAAPTPGALETARIRFSAGGRLERRRLEAGRPAAVFVTVPKPGQVDLPALGLSAPAEPLTPARFDVLRDEPGRVEVRYAPAGERESRVVGELAVVAGGTQGRAR
jgi:hypothetical protein